MRPACHDGHDGIDIRARAYGLSGVARCPPLAPPPSGTERRTARLDAVLNSAEQPRLRKWRSHRSRRWLVHSFATCAAVIRVRAGDRVTAGQAVGLIGLSGRTEFTHVHMALRHNNETLDPLTGNSLSSLHCGASIASGTHWSAAARSALAYRGAQWFATGFTAAPSQGANVETLPSNVTRQPARWCSGRCHGANDRRRSVRLTRTVNFQ
jgi:hypothetical protein